MTNDLFHLEWGSRSCPGICVLTLGLGAHVYPSHPRASGPPQAQALAWPGCTPKAAFKGPKWPWGPGDARLLWAEVGQRSHLGLGHGAGGRWPRSRWSWAAAEVGSLASSSLLVLFLACRPCTARPFSSPETHVSTGHPKKVAEWLRGCPHVTVLSPPAAHGCGP